jgi:hypothetical protein
MTQMRRDNSYNEKSVIARSECDGWTLGYIGIPWPGPWPKKNGDLFVTDPDGWQAGIAWESSDPEILDISGVSEGRWGVFQVKFPIAVMSEDDLIKNFHMVLPLLKKRRALVPGFSS